MFINRNLLLSIQRKPTLSWKSDSIQIAKKPQKKENEQKIDLQFVMKEILQIKNKQENLEKVCSLILNQNNQVINENKLLTNYIIQEKQKKDKKEDKLLMLIMNSPLFTSNQQEIEKIEEESKARNKKIPIDNVKKLIRRYRSPQVFQIRNYEMRDRNLLDKIIQKADQDIVCKQLKRNNGDQVKIKQDSIYDLLKGDQVRFTFSGDLQSNGDRKEDDSQFFQINHSNELQFDYDNIISQERQMRKFQEEDFQEDF